MTALKEIDTGGDSLCNLAIGNGYLIFVRNIEGHIAPQHTVTSHIILMFMFSMDTYTDGLKSRA